MECLKKRDNKQEPILRRMNMESGKKRDLAALAFIPLVMTLANSMLVPVLPQIEKSLGINDLKSSMIITVYSIASIVLIPVAGFLSDKFGRKKVMVPSLIITGTGGLLSGLSALLFKNPYGWILAGRILQGIGASGAFPVVIPCVGDMFREEADVSKGLGIIETANTVGKVLSPILGAALGLLAWYVPFLAIPVLSGMAAFFIIIWVKVKKGEDETQKKKFGEFMKELGGVFREKGKWLYPIFLMGFICMFVHFGDLFYLSSILEDKYGFEGVLKGLLMAIPLLFLSIASFVTGGKIGSKKVLMKWIAFAGSLLTAVSVAWIGFVQNLVLIMAIFSVASTGIGCALPCLDSLITEGIRKEHRGTISSIFSGARLVGVALGPRAISLLLGWNLILAFVVLAGTAVVSALAALFFIKPGNGGKTQGESP